VYHSAPLERTDQQDFLNAVAVVDTNENVETVFASLRSIEETLKKHPPYRFGPRTIDLDLLLYDNLILPDQKTWGEIIHFPLSIIHSVVLPHPRLHERRFVLEPLCDVINPETMHPVLQQSFGALLKNVQNQQCTKTPLLL